MSVKPQPALCDRINYISFSKTSCSDGSFHGVNESGGFFWNRWIVQAMKHELKIRAGDMPPQDIYQMSPSDVKQLLLDVLQPQQTGR